MSCKKLRLTLSLLAVALLFAISLVCVPSACAMTTVHGNIYEWSSFDTLTNVVIEVNSQPPQTMVSKTGSYSFNLPSGDYTIIAKWGSGSNILSTQETITITGDGDYIIDLILFPGSSIDDLEILDDNITAIVPDEPVQDDQNFLLLAAMLFIILFVLGFVGYVLFFRKKSVPKKEQIKEIKHVTDIFEEPEKPENNDIQKVPEPPPVQPPVIEQTSKDLTLPEDLREILHILEKNGGRMTQLDLRKALPYSEAKVSLMITDLENRGLIKKIKKGRGNIILLADKDKNNF